MDHNFTPDEEKSENGVGMFMQSSAQLKGKTFTNQAKDVVLFVHCCCAVICDGGRAGPSLRP